jgi:ligand-binding SRPBCC domain-containing protein
MDDLIAMILLALEDRNFRGAINATSPNPCTQEAFSQAVAAAVSRPVQIPVPAAALRLRYGAAASVLTDSHRALPLGATEAGFRFQYPSRASALKQCLGASDHAAITRITDSNHGTAWRLTDTMDVEAPLEEVAGFFANPRNLGAITPAWLSFHFVQIPDVLVEGSQLVYQIRIGGLPMRWVTRLTRWNLPFDFRDEQERGPYRVWSHFHSFERLAHGGTRIHDEVVFAARFGLLGRLAERLFVCNQVRRIFAYRRSVTSHRFGAFQQHPQENYVA